MRLARILETVPVIALLATAGCSTEGVPLQENHNEQHLRMFDIRSSAIVKDADDNAVLVRPSGIYDASPLTPNNQLVGSYLQTAGVKAARYPLGWGCDLTLDFVFDNESADATTSESYNLSALDNLSTELVKYIILPIWQAAWDIGYDGCVSTPSIGVATRPISNPDKWGLVTSYQATRLNNLVRSYYKDDRIAALAARGLKPGYVEIYPDATDTGSYGDLSISSLSQAYNNFFDAFNESLPPASATNETSKRIIGVIAPGISISDSSELSATYSSMMDFITDLTNNPAHLPDVFSIKPEVDSLSSLIDVVKAVRAKLDGMGFDSIPMMAIDTTLTPETWKSLETSQPGIADRSMWLGAFTAAAFARLQGELLTIAPQRWSENPLDPQEPHSGEDLFQDTDGSSLPAMFVLKALREFSEAGSELISFENAAPIDDPAVMGDTDPGDDVTVLASRLTDGGYQFLVVALPPANVDRAGVRIRYILNVTDIQAGTTDWDVRIAEIDAESTSYRMNSRGTATVDDGQVSFSSYIKGPAVQVIRFSPPTTDESAE